LWRNSTTNSRAGNILADILEVHPRLQGAVFELPTTADAAKRHLQQRGLAHRAKVFAGNFLQTVASGYDAYLIKSTLHDFDDDQSVQLLSNIRDAMPAHGRVLVAEILFDPGKPVPHPHRFIDLEMMVTFGGRERSTNEYAELLHCAGLRIKEVHMISDSVFSLIEALQA
jgi:O-methyltransferase